MLYPTWPGVLRGSSTHCRLIMHLPSAGRCSVLRTAAARPAAWPRVRQFRQMAWGASAGWREFRGHWEPCFGAFCRQRHCRLERGAAAGHGTRAAAPGPRPWKGARAPGVRLSPCTLGGGEAGRHRPAARRPRQRRPRARQAARASRRCWWWAPAGARRPPRRCSARWPPRPRRRCRAWARRAWCAPRPPRADPSPSFLWISRAGVHGRMLGAAAV